MKHRSWFGLLTRALLVWLTSAFTVVAAPSATTAEKTTLTIKGMTCGGCVATVKLKLKKTKGVLAYDVSLERGEADVTYDPTLSNPEAIAASVSETGFTATVKGNHNPDGKKDGGEDASANWPP